MRLSDRMEVGFDLRPRPSPDALVPPLTRHEVLLLPRQLLVRLQRAGDGAGHLRHELVLLGRSRPRYRGGRRPARSWPGWLRRSPGERWRPRSPGEVGGGLGDPPGEAHQEQPGHEQGDEATSTALIRHLAGSSPGSLRDEPFCQPDDSGTARVEAAFGPPPALVHGTHGGRPPPAATSCRYSPRCGCERSAPHEPLQGVAQPTAPSGVRTVAEERPLSCVRSASSPVSGQWSS